MFILQLLPTSALEFVIFGILGFGFVATVISLFFIGPLLKLIPSLSAYSSLVKLMSISVFLTGVYLWGSYSTEVRWRERVESAEEAAKEAKLKFDAVNLELTKTIAQRDHAVATRGTTIIKQTTEYLKGDIQTHINTVDMSELERKELQRQIEELRKAEKECPVPKLIVKGINQAADPIK
jgi:hypothetical protein